MGVLLVICNFPDAASARHAAKELVENRLAACANVLAPCHSIYRWHGVIESATEVPVLLKTSEERFVALSEAIRGLHPYEVPEIVALEVTRGAPSYLQWVIAETQGSSEAGK
jgi:periplasmic divalent cation tolerance protein